MPQTDLLKSIEAVIKTAKCFELSSKINFKRKKYFVIVILFLSFSFLSFYPRGHPLLNIEEIKSVLVSTLRVTSPNRHNKTAGNCNPLSLDRILHFSKKIMPFN